MRRIPGRVVAGLVRSSLADLRRARLRLREGPEDPGALHLYRKQTRRLAAGVQLLELYLTPVQHGRAVRLVGPLADGLGRLRDDDVAQRRLKVLARGKSKAVARGLDDAVRPLSALKRQRRVQRTLRRSRKAFLDERLEGILGQVRPLWLDPLVVLRYRLAERSRGVGATSSIATLHALRLELKAYRYAVELLGREASPADLAAGKQAHRATEALGRVMDAHALAGLAPKAPPAAARSLLAAATRDDRAARADFGKGWEGGWPALRDVTRGPVGVAALVTGANGRSNRLGPSGPRWA